MFALLLTIAQALAIRSIWVFNPAFAARMRGSSAVSSLAIFAPFAIWRSLEPHESAEKPHWGRNP